MKQSLDDGSTVGIARLPGPREVQLDEKMAQACDEYYRLQAEAGANEYQIEKSKKDMTNLKIILGNSDRLDIVVRHFIWHYEKRCEEHATVNGKAMFVCYDREIAWTVYNKIKARGQSGLLSVNVLRSMKAPPSTETPSKSKRSCSFVPTAKMTLLR